MFAQDEPKVKLSKITGFNRYLYLVLIINLFIYTLQLDFSRGFVTGMLIIGCWLGLGVHAFVNEVTRKVVKKSIIATPEVCLVLSRTNTVLTALLISGVTLGTGNTVFMFLYLIPVFHNLFSSCFKLSMGVLVAGMLVFLGTDLTGWFRSDVLIFNKHIFTFNMFTYTTIIGLLAYLGMVLSSQAIHNSENASIFHNMATTDSLTGLINRREFNRRIAEEVARAKRHKSPLCLALFDIDFFKRINDTYGHAAGDQVLRELGELISVNTRGCDVAARHGGEEFALILPETTAVEAYELLERLRVMVEMQFFYLSYTPVQTTISVGVAQYDFMDSCAADLCERADRALYQAKRNGRNRVETASFSLPKLDLSKALAAAKEAREREPELVGKA